MSFTQILNLSISASWLVLAVIAARFALKQAPKALHCALWALVAFRLLCPISIESELSLIPTREVIPQEYLTMEPQDSGFSQSAALDLVTNPVYDVPLQIEIEPTVDRIQHWDMIGTVLWLAGVGAMAIYAAYSYLNLRLRTRMAAKLRDNLFECDEIDSPFILGILFPRIYLPSGLDEQTCADVLAHENAHLKRLDHIWKPLGFALLTIHWFNPIMWLAYILLCRDIELACDERVITKLDKQAVRSYSESLVRCAVTHRSIALCPLAFGEIGVKGRIKAMVHYRRPGFWIITFALITALILAVCFLTDPAMKADSMEQLLEREDCAVFGITEQTIKLEIRKDDLPEDVLNGRKHRFDDAPILLAEYDDTILSLIEARMSGDELLATIALDHKLGEEGSVLLPYNPLVEGPESYVHMAHRDVADSERVYGDTVRIRETGRSTFSVAIKMDVWNQAKDYIRFQLEGLYALQYGLGYHLETTQIVYLDTVRIYQAEGVSAFTAPQFQLHSDGTFSMIPNAFTSYHARGRYTLEDGELEMRTDDNRFIYYFTVEDGAYIYDRDRSNDIEYYYDAYNFAPLPEGTRFVLTDRWQFAGEELDSLISANLEKSYGASVSPDLLNVISHQILDFSCASGTPLAGTLEPSARLTVYLAAVCRSFRVNDGELNEAHSEVLNAAMTFQSTANGIQFIGLLDTSGSKLDHVYSTTAREIWDYRKDSITEILSERCLLLAQEQLLNPPTDDQIGKLLSIICSSPLQSSNPGDYINAHPSEYGKLLELGKATVAYSFRAFSQGGGMDLMGHIMALACREIIGQTEDIYADGTYMTGQAWFNNFAAKADGLLETQGIHILQINFPYHAMALQALGIL